ncbi:MAG TPA: ABC transporter permease, partial [Polyangiaceae bacterium]|nr:ABC transporter permease [Polyangiaceae bacterium]
LRKGLGFFELFVHDRQAIWDHFVRHLELTLLAMGLCLMVGLPLGYAATRSSWAASLALGTSGALQTIPSLALLVFAIPIVAALFAPLGQSALVLEGAALVALFLYALLPVVRNTKEGIEGVDVAVIEAARGVGMTERQLLAWVKFPLALPVIIAGVRTSFVITVGGATLAAFVGAGGLGVPIITGLSVQNFAEVWTGAVPAALLALGSDGAFGLMQRWLKRRLFGAPA